MSDTGGALAPAATRVIPPGTVELWRIPLDVSASNRERLTACLDESERRQWDRMRVGGDRWAVARAARRLLLAKYAGVPAESLRFEAGELGKPRLAGELGVRFSTSAREGLALLAVAADRELGVDVEREAVAGDVSELARQFLSPLEQAAVAAAPPERSGAVFAAAWTRHEALRKLWGLGLEDPLPPLANGEVVSVRAVSVAPGFAAAVAAGGGAWQASVLDAAEELTDQRAPLHGIRGATRSAGLSS